MNGKTRTTTRKTSAPVEQVEPAPALQDMAVGAYATALRANHRLLQWFEQAQQAELHALHDWTATVKAAADRAAGAKTLNDVMAAEGGLLTAGFAQLASGRSELLASWLQLQAELASEIRHQAGDTTLAPLPGAFTAPAVGQAGEPSPSPTELYAQALATAEKVMAGWVDMVASAVPPKA